MAARARSRFDRDEVGPQNDVYTGLLAISLVAMLVSCVLLYLDYNQYAGKPVPPLPSVPTTRGPAVGMLPPPLPIGERPSVGNGVAEGVNPAGAVVQPGPEPVVTANSVVETPVAQPPAAPMPSAISASTPPAELPPAPVPPQVLPPEQLKPAPIPAPPAAEAPKPSPSDPPPLPKSMKQLPGSDGH